MKILLIVLALTATVLTAGCKRGDQPLHDSKAKACSSFSGGKLSATWTECPDKVRREVTCAPFIDALKCDCLEDGAEKWFFYSRSPSDGAAPPLSTREDATRVANANCHWSLESGT